MSIQYQNHGVFCLEGLWESDLKDRTSVLPLLQLLKQRGICDFIFHKCATTEEFEFFLNKWKQAAYKKQFPILYLGFHGDQNILYVDARKGKRPYSLTMLADLLDSKCANAIIYFASCATLGVDERKINTFLKKTRFLAALGYQYDLDWIKSAALDLMILEALQVEKFDSRGAEKICDYLVNNVGKLHKQLDLRFVINKTFHFPRKRVKKSSG
jgi:hypothetical protein